jgi:predicted GH43/DUF377 family glycosyl hydrolase
VPGDASERDPEWTVGPFTRRAAITLRPDPSLRFACPVARTTVAWAAKDLFNPAAIVREGAVHLLVRAEDRIGRYAGTSRIGLATSRDGVAFTLDPEPVLHPADDKWQTWEWPGGCEDPRVVEAPDGGYVCTYTAFDGKRGHLFVATSDDLRTWTKHGPAFRGSPYALRASKSGAIVTEVVDGRLIAARRDGRFFMYWGEGVCFAATSEDLVQWQPLDFDAWGDHYLTFDAAQQSFGIERVRGPRALRPLLFPRLHRFDSGLVEPGPPAVATPSGTVLLYNGANAGRTGARDSASPPFAYQPGQALFDPLDATACIARTPEPFLRATTGAEQQGQVDNVCFATGLVTFEGQWHLYYGMADSTIGCAVARFDPEVHAAGDRPRLS